LKIVEQKNILNLSCRFDAQLVLVRV